MSDLSETAKKRPMRLGSRVVLVCVVSVIVATLSASVFGYTLTKHSVKSEVDNSLRRDAKRLARNYINQLLVSGDILRTPGAASGMAVAVIDTTGTPRGTTFDPGLIDRACADVAGGKVREHRSNHAIDGSQTRFVCVAIVDQLPPNGRRQSDKRLLAKGLAIVVGRDVDAVESQQNNLALGFGAIGLGSALLAVLLGIVISRDTTRSVKTLADVTTAISTDLDLFRTVRVEGPAELQQLAVNFNRMIGALIESRERQRRLIDDTAHELRTPVTSLKTNLALLQRSDELDPIERASILEQLQSQFKELALLIDDVQLLAIENSNSVQFGKLDFAQVVRSAIERVDHRRIGVEIESVLEPSPIIGSSDELERAVVNVLDNAYKWSPPGGVVRVELRNGTLRIADQGPGIAAEDREFVFDRFWRAASSRPMPGSGLGLAIVADVVQRHRGTVRIEEPTRREGRARPGAAAAALPASVDQTTSTDQTTRAEHFTSAEHITKANEANEAEHSANAQHITKARQLEEPNSRARPSRVAATGTTVVITIPLSISKSTSLAQTSPGALTLAGR